MIRFYGESSGHVVVMRTREDGKIRCVRFPDHPGMSMRALLALGKVKSAMHGPVTRCLCVSMAESLIEDSKRLGRPLTIALGSYVFTGDEPARDTMIAFYILRNERRRRAT